MSGVAWEVFLRTLHAGKTITFSRDSATFRRLQLIANGGVLAEKSVYTTDGDLNLLFENGDLHLNADVDIIATGGDLILSSLTHHITAQTPSSLQTSTHDIMLNKHVTINRDATKNTTFRIYALRDLYVNSTVRFVGEAPPVMPHLDLPIPDSDSNKDVSNITIFLLRYGSYAKCRLYEVN